MADEARYLIACSQNLDEERFRLELLEELEISVLTVDMAVDVDLVFNYIRPRSEVKLLGLSCHTWLDEEVLVESVIDGLNQALSAHADVEHVVKLRDSKVIAQNRKVAEEIYELESDLREALSMAFLDSGIVGSNYYEILANSNVRQAPDKPSPADLKSALLNEFSYLSFADYRNVVHRRQPGKANELATLIEQSTNFEELQISLAPRVLLNESAAEFVARLQDTLTPLEAARNAVMHSRPMTSRTRQNYERASRQLRTAIAEYLEGFTFEHDS